MGEQRLGGYLKDRRGRLDPVSLGFAPGRRRTPGLRREEVAQRAGISATWYTWLEQERGGRPSAEALDRISEALMLTEAEREHLYLLGLGRLPPRRYREDVGVTPRLQRVLEALEPTPALIRTATWDVVAWNVAATVMLTDFGAASQTDRNMLRFMFLHPRMREAYSDWVSVARYVVGTFRSETARAGASEAVRPLVEELCALSPEFKRVWSEAEPVTVHGEAVKQMRHPKLGEIDFEYSAFAVDGRPDLSLLIYKPVSERAARKIGALVEEAAGHDRPCATPGGSRLPSPRAAGVADRGR